MRTFKEWVFTFFSIIAAMSSIPVSMAETWINVENNVSTGKIIIDGQEFGTGAGQYLKGSGKKTTVTRNLAGYNRIKIGGGGFDVVHSTGKSYSFKITGDDNIIPWIETEVKERELQLSITRSFSTKLPITVTITSPDLEALALEGSSTIKLNDIQASHFLIHSVGTGDIFASGQAETLTIRIFGAGDVNVKKLVTEQAQVKLQGSGDVVLTARKSLIASVTGTGDINYYGRPKEVHTEIFGVGDIEPGE